MENSNSPPSFHLPEGILTEILKKLPVKDLLRYRTVCKSWPSIISSPHFIKSHLHQTLISAHKTPTLLTLEKKPLEQHVPIAHMIRTVFQTLMDDGVDVEEINRRVEEARINAWRLDLCAYSVCFDHVVIPKLFPFCQVVGSCNGIVCLASNFAGNSIYLWNPSIKQYKKLPVPQRYLTRSIPALFGLGFGFDSVCNDYKVLRFKDLSDEELIVQLYSANADSWREFVAPTLSNWQWKNVCNVVVGGVMYFDGGVSFDLHEEVFRLFPSPSFATQRLSVVFDFEGSVGVIFECSGEDEGIYFCTLDTVCGTWRKEFSVDTRNLLLLLYVGAGLFYGKKLYNDDGYNRSLYSILYDWRKRETYYYEPPVPVENSFEVLKYTESLVSIKGFQQVQ